MLFTRLFLPDADQHRPCLGCVPAGGSAEHWNHVLFHEYFHPETGEGLGASHQTGWTALIASCIDKLHPRDP